VDSSVLGTIGAVQYQSPCQEYIQALLQRQHSKHSSSAMLEQESEA
jgi:hypothetical protein